MKTCKSMAVSFQCMTKFTTNKKKMKKKIKWHEETFYGGKWQISKLAYEKIFNTINEI